jgi:hypothetical protein
MTRLVFLVVLVVLVDVVDTSKQLVEELQVRE